MDAPKEYPLSDSEKLLSDTLQNLKEGVLLQFVGSEIRIYEEFDPHLKSWDIDPEAPLNSAELHMGSLGEMLPVGTVSQLEGVPTRPVDDTPAASEAFEIEAFLVRNAAMYPEAGDVSHLIEQRKSRLNEFVRDLREYATLLVEQDSFDLNEQVPCKGHDKMTKDYGFCPDCDGSGGYPKYPVITFVNANTNESTVLTANVAQLLADGKINIRWRPRDEEFNGIEGEGPILDIEGFIKQLYQELGLEYDTLLEISIEDNTVAKPYHGWRGNEIDENSFIPDAIDRLQFILARHLKVDPYRTVAHKPVPVSRLLKSVRGIVEEHGYTLGYTHKCDGSTDWEPRHSFFAMSLDGRQTFEFMPDDFPRRDLDQLDVALEEALLWLENPLEQPEQTD